MAAPAESSHDTALGDMLTYQRVHKLLHDINDYSLQTTRKHLMLAYVFLILVYIGLNVALLGANFKSQEFIESHYYRVFHMLSFWGVFVFTLLEAFVLLTSGSILFNYKNTSQSSLVLFNVLATFATALLFTIFPETYEIPCHWLEYSVQILITVVNFIFIINYLATQQQRNFFYRYRYVEIAVAGVIVIMSIIQLIVFSGVMHLKMGAERAAHFFEFSNEIANGLFALMYAVLSYMDLGKKAKEHWDEMHLV